MKNLLNKVNHYILYHPFFLGSLKEVKHSPFKQCVCAFGHATWLTIFPMLIILWYTYLENNIISKSIFVALYISMFLLWAALSYAIIKEHKLLENVSFKKFGPNNGKKVLMKCRPKQ